MLTVILGGERATFSLQFQGKMLKCVFCALLMYTYITINTDDRRMAAK